MLRFIGLPASRLPASPALTAAQPGAAIGDVNAAKRRMDLLPPPGAPPG